MKAYHSNLGEVEITEYCLALDMVNPDPTTCHVDYLGETIEVTRAFVRIAGDAERPQDAPGAEVER